MANYALATSYSGESLLSGFNWFDGADPSHGFVSYQSRPNAEALGLYSVDENTGVVRLGVDSTNTYSTFEQGRPSIRLESKESYNHGLFIADFLHMPPSQCGLWPAFWTYGPNWPAGGEVDIIEGANDQYHNILSAHTAPGCSVGYDLSSDFSGFQRSTNCDIGTDNVGCGYESPVGDASAYGDGFNAANGGVYAMEWDDEYIKIWHFARGNIPRDIHRKEPDPEGWGLPDAVFGGQSCDVDNFFKDMSLVININFCGDWGNAIWGRTDGCGAYASTCSEYVGSNPGAFANAYWDVRYIDAYQKSNEARPSPPSNPSPDEPASSTTTMTTSLTTTVTVNGHKTTKIIDGNAKHTPRPDITTSFISPSEAAAPQNPTKVDDSAYLGCYSSSDGFKTFHMVQDSKDMTVGQCVKLCRDSMFAGVYDTQCFCADSLDANTRAASAKDGDVCDHPCPGDDAQYCGGLAKNIGDLANTTAPVKNEKFDNSPVATGAPNYKFTNSTGNTTLQNTFHVASKKLQARRMDKNILLTVYGVVKNETPPPPPPPMAPGQNVTYTFTDYATETKYKTVVPVEETGAPDAKFVVNTRPGKSMKDKTVTETIRPTEVVIEDCASTEDPTVQTSQIQWHKSSRFDPPVPVETETALPTLDTSEGDGSPTPAVVTAGAGGAWSETKLVTLGLAVVVVALLL